MKIKNHRLAILHSSNIYNSQVMEATYMSINRGMDKKMWYIYTMEYYSAIKMNKIGSFVEMWMDLESVIQSEVRKRKTNIVY